MSNTIKDIDDKFTSRLVRVDALGAPKARPINPFANRSFHDTSSLEMERNMAPEVSALKKVGAVYGGGPTFGSIAHVLFDKRAINHPGSNLRLKTTNKIPTDGTREK